MIKRILVGLGGTPFAGTATRRAIELAAAHGAEVTAVTLVDRDSFEDTGFSLTGSVSETRDAQEDRDQITRAVLEESVSSFVDNCEKANVRSRVLWESGEPMDLLVSAARYHDLVICGLRGLFDYGLTANPKDSLVRLVRRGVVPILASAQKYRPVTRVMAAYSGSSDSARALKTFIQLNLWPQCELYLVSFHEDDATADRLLSEAAAYCRAHGQSPRLHHAAKDPESAILEAARAWDADLVVLGDSSHAAISRRLLGDTLLDVVRRSDRALLLAH